MVKTTELLTYPKPGTVVPEREYSAEQVKQIDALREVRNLSCAVHWQDSGINPVRTLALAP